MSHTPGPWHYGSFLITAEPGYLIALLSEDNPQRVDDGFLIAAASDLLKAAKEAHEFLCGCDCQDREEADEVHEVCRQLQEAIRKAEMKGNG